MPNIYVSPETKSLLEELMVLDGRKQEGEINHLCKQRIKELSAPSSDNPSLDGPSNSTNLESECQGENDAA